MAQNSSTHTATNPTAAKSPIGNIASLQDKIALITGGSSGLGRAIVQAYAAAGAYVVSADLTPTPAPAPTVAENLHGIDVTTPTVELVNSKWPSARDGVDRARFVECDVTSEESVKAAVAFAVQSYGRLDVMVNNAGISAETSAAHYTGRFSRIHETDVSILDKTLAINVRGVWLGTKYACLQFLSQEPHAVFGHTATSPSDIHRGWIINLASIAASVGIAGASSYCTSKGAVLQLTRTTALEYAKDGIHINAIQPGFADTPLLENMYAKAEGGRAGVDQLMVMLHPWGRTGRPEDIARVAVFLAGEGATWVTGSGVVVDGGYLAQ